jgi:hypothetical protein
LPKRHWHAAEHLFDLKLSHWVEIFLTAALVFVGVAQFYVYSRQAEIMNTQTEIAKNQLEAMLEDKKPWMNITLSFANMDLSDWNGTKQILVH